jgi:hypothetical protein
MKSIAITAATALAVTLAPSPCRAADDMRTPGDQGRQAAAFAGANIRLPLGGKRAARPTARLQLGMVDRSYGAGRVPAGGLELGLTGRGKPEMFLGGRSAGDVRQRMKLNGSTGTTMVVVFGVVLLVVGVYVITNLDSLGDSES